MLNVPENRDTLETLARVYQESMQKVDQAYAMLHEAHVALEKAYGNTSFSVLPPRNAFGDPEEYVTTIRMGCKRQAWMTIFDRTGVRKLLSIKRNEELNNQLYNSHKESDFPEITVENMLAFIQDTGEKAVDYANEAVYEVFEWLRPGPHSKEYKTNQKWKLGSKVIVEYCVEKGYGSAPFRVIGSRKPKLMALDNVVHMLSGQGPLKGYSGPLCDAISTSDTGAGTTEHFVFKCYKNNNIHLEFRNKEIVDKINMIAGNRSQLGGTEG